MLNLPTVALLDCPRWEGLHLDTGCPRGVDAILLDGLEDPDDFARIASAIRMVLKKPVIGAVEALPATRRALADAPRNLPVPEALFAPLASSFLKFADFPALKALARSRPFPPCSNEPD